MRPETSRRERSQELLSTPRPASTLGCEELRRLAKGCSRPYKHRGSPQSHMDASQTPKQKKCSLGLQVTVEPEAGLFWQQRRKQLWPLSHRKQPPVLVAQDPRRSRGAAQPAADRQRLGTARALACRRPARAQYELPHRRLHGRCWICQLCRCL